MDQQVAPKSSGQFLVNLTKSIVSCSCAKRVFSGLGHYRCPLLLRKAVQMLRKSGSNEHSAQSGTQCTYPELQVDNLKIS